METEVIVAEGSFNRPIHIVQVPPGIWKFEAKSLPFHKELLKDLTDDLREEFYLIYPHDRSILQQLFDGDTAVWSKIRKGNVPQMFFYLLIDESASPPFSKCLYSPYLPAAVFSPKIYPKWQLPLDLNECKARTSLFFSKLYKYRVKNEKMEIFNREMVDYFEIYPDKIDIVAGVDISNDLKKVMIAPLFSVPFDYFKKEFDHVEEIKKQRRWEFSYNDAIARGAMLPEKYRSKEAINDLFPNITELTFYEIEDSDFDGSGFSDYCGLGKCLNFNLLELIPAWSQNLTTLTYVISRKWGNVDAYKGNLRKLLQLANDCPNLVHFRLGMPFTNEGSINLVNGKGRKVGDWSFMSRLKSFHLSYPFYSKGPLAAENLANNQKELVNIFKRLKPDILEDFGLHISGRVRPWLEVLHKLQDEAPGVFNKITKLRLPKNSPNTRADLIALVCQCFELKYLDFYLHNYHTDFMELANLHRTLTTLFIRADTPLTPITKYTMEKMPIFNAVTVVRIDPGHDTGNKALPRSFLDRVFPNADPYLLTKQPSNNNLNDYMMSVLMG